MNSTNPMLKLGLFTTCAVVIVALAFMGTRINGADGRSSTSQALPITIDEYDALSREERAKVRFQLPKALQAQISTRDHAIMKERLKKDADEAKAQFQIYVAGRLQIKELFSYAREVEDNEIKGRFPAPSDPECVKLLNASEELWQSRKNLLRKAPEAAQVGVWKKYESAFKKVSERFPTSKPTAKSVQDLEKELKPLLRDLDDLAKAQKSEDE